MPTFHIEQFGCRATQADGAAIERQLLDRGCTIAPSAVSADVIVINTCTVTAAADAQSRDAIRKFHAANPDTQIIVTGCYAQRAPEEIAALPGVSFVVGNSHKPQIPDLISPSPAAAHHEICKNLHIPRPAPPASSAPIHCNNRSVYLWWGHEMPCPPRRKMRTTFIHRDPKSWSLTSSEPHPRCARPRRRRESHSSHSENQDGCNNRCSFCVIPFVRGKNRLTPETILNKLAASPIRLQEIVLAGSISAPGAVLAPPGFSRTPFAKFSMKRR
jgi:threonylcarbamoyladenosine tRNA methylthiotransferase MtaB